MNDLTPEERLAPLVESAIRIAVNAERERCARILEHEADTWESEIEPSGYIARLRQLAEFIRTPPVTSPQ